MRQRNSDPSPGTRDGRKSMTGVENANIQDAIEALMMTQCPHYRGDGVCESGCRSEPACETCEPTEGWVGHALALLESPEKDAD